MRRGLVLLLALTVLACSVVAQADGGPMDSSKEKTYGNKDQTKYYDKAGCNQKDRCTEKSYFYDSSKRCFIKCCEECSYFVVCDKCSDKHRCDSYCDRCGEKCRAYEYCPSCGARYATDSPDGYCDQCGKVSFLFKECDKCGYHYYYNGYCEKCGAKCHYDKTCSESCEKHCYSYANRCDDACGEYDRCYRPAKPCGCYAEKKGDACGEPSKQDWYND